MKKGSIVITLLVIVAIGLAIFLMAKLSHIPKQEGSSDSLPIMEKIAETNESETMRNQSDGTAQENTVVLPQELEGKSGEEKAIYLVQKDWKDPSNVKFEAQPTEETDQYKVCVKEKENGQEIVWYEVNVVKGTIKML